jgi:hypothetical protein
VAALKADDDAREIHLVLLLRMRRANTERNPNFRLAKVNGSLIMRCDDTGRQIKTMGQTFTRISGKLHSSNYSSQLKFTQQASLIFNVLICQP